MQPVPFEPGEPQKEDIVIHFEDGIYGFEDVKDFVLLEKDESRVIWSLRAAEGDIPSLVVVDPFVIMPGYRPSLTEAELKSIGSPEKGELCFLAVAVIRRKLEESAVNLKSPIAINTLTRQGRQVIMENSDYPVRYRPFGGARNGR